MCTCIVVEMSSVRKYSEDRDSEEIETRRREE